MPEDVKKFIRIDFVFVAQDFDSESGMATFVAKPDPRRYEWKDVDGKQLLYDKLEKVYFGEDVLGKLYGQMKGKQMHFEPRQIGSAETYVESRRPHVEKILDGIAPEQSFEDKSEAFLESLEGDRLGFVIVAVDVVGSTSLSTMVDPKVYARIISTLLFELSEITSKFNGHVLKYTGDGLIAYFPEPSLMTKSDLAIDCALTFRALVYGVLNPILSNRGIPQIHIRTAIDAGEAYLVTIGSPATKQQKDIIGALVNLTAKMQGRADPGGVLIGNTALRHLHVTWRQICEPIEMGIDWQYRDDTGEAYRVHGLKLGMPK